VEPVSGEVGASSDVFEHGGNAREPANASDPEIRKRIDAARGEADGMRTEPGDDAWSSYLSRRAARRKIATTSGTVTTGWRSRAAGFNWRSCWRPSPS